MTTDEAWMDRALGVARRALGGTGNNPAVGAVVVRDGVVLAEGWTQPPGQDHAEPHALRQIGGAARGSTLYVTLEPCCHHGRTPPCTDAIIRAGVARVVVGIVDPFPLVSGRGIAILRAAGIEVDVGIDEAACRKMNLGFLRVVAGGLPDVTLKAAVTLDGRIASAAGESKWITGPEARAAGHVLRAEHDAVLVGVGTVLADDPELTVRYPGPARDPWRVVLDSGLRTPLTAKVLGRRCIVYGLDPLTERAAELRERGAQVVGVPGGQGGLDVGSVLCDLVARGVRRVLVEGGGAVHRSMLGGGFADRLELFLNGRVLAGGPGFVGGPGFSLAEAPGFTLSHFERVGPDVHMVWESQGGDRRVPPESP